MSERKINEVKIEEIESRVATKEEWENLSLAVETFKTHGFGCEHRWIYTPLITVCKKCKKVKL